MLLINITERAYPLASLSIRSGDTILGKDDFGLAALMPGECLLAHSEGADLSTVFVPCNETGARPLLAPVLLSEKIEIDSGSTISRCAGIVCLAVYEGSA